ncbi:MAG: hypothetical protein WD468_00240 [Pirellulales bacterium]
MPCLTALVVLFAGTGATAQDSAAGGVAGARSGAQQLTTAAATPAGDRLLVQTINQFERHSSVTARLRHQASIGGVELYGVGSYWQQGRGESMRVRMELQIAGQDASLLQVLNRGFLWVDRRLPNGRTVTRVDLRQLRADPVLSAGELESILPGQASWSPIQPEVTVHCGGLSSLLAALGDNFSFLPPQAMRLALAPPTAEKATNIPVFAVVGHWKPEKQAALTGESSGLRVEGRESEAEHKLPERLPQEVLLLVGQADLFPYRIEYRRLETPRAADEKGGAIPYQLSANPFVVLELSDVTFDVPIQGGQFDYNPRDVDWVDQTAKLLERLRKQRQAEVAQRDGAGQAR